MPFSLTSFHFQRALRVSFAAATGVVGAFFLPSPVSAQQEAAPAAAASGAEAASDFEKQSLALRTALHYDASLESPLKSLVALYRGADI